MHYATQSDIENIFGPMNVAAWSLYETGTPTETTDPARIESALTYADAEVNAFFAGGPYAVPLQPSSTAPTVTYWAAVIAGVWLYGSRAGVSYVDYAGNRYLAQKAAVYADMQLYKAAIKRLDAAVKFQQPNGPSAV